MLFVRDISYLEHEWVRDENIKSLTRAFTIFPDMGEKTVISIVLQNILKTISDGDLLNRQRCLMLHGSLIFFFYHSPLSIPSTTGYHSVRYLYHYTLFIQLLH